MGTPIYGTPKSFEELAMDEKTKTAEDNNTSNEETKNK